MLRFIDGVGYVDIPDKENDWYDVPSDEMTLGQARQAVKDLRKKLAEYLERESCEDAISRKITREEALKEFIGYQTYDIQPSVEATKMAIEALKQELILDNIRAKIKEQIDYHDEEHRKYDSEEEFGISLGLELALTIVNKEVKPQESEVEE